MENLVIAPSYYEQPDPYINAPSCLQHSYEQSFPGEGRPYTEVFDGAGGEMTC